MGSDRTIFWIVMMIISSLISMVAQPQILASTAAYWYQHRSAALVGSEGGLHRLVARGELELPPPRL